ncbi:signal peptidase II [Peribacillus simplex]|uniref:Lipoprotein signal peptidase n=2 Tax=Peribacillus TaxID=2675229 RepID=A0AA90PCM6_9BACI|nr:MULTISPECIES: signal peptidase II [Peribacillus]MDP1420343.1 signal peptidase II [Peribacillus simplex]MDP1453424.1 signal peptidase II [Peribacillus frigoritolerans]
MLYYIIALIIITLDQFTKWLIVKELEIGESIPVIENVLYITSSRNQGAAWGILQNQMWFFYVITVIVVIGLVIYIQKYVRNQRLIGIALGLMLGGAIGNFVDRIFHKEVVDFIQTYIGSYPFPIFNVADSSLCIGVSLLFIHMFFEDKQKKNVNQQI